MQEPTNAAPFSEREAVTLAARHLILRSLHIRACWTTLNIFLGRRCSRARRVGESERVTVSSALLTSRILHQITLVHVDSAMLHDRETDRIAKPVCVSLSLTSAPSVFTDHLWFNADTVIPGTVFAATRHEVCAAKQVTEHTEDQGRTTSLRIRAATRSTC